MSTGSITAERPPLSWLDPLIAFLLGVIPFCVVVRLPPNPGFWGQWSAFAIVGLWLAARWPSVRAVPRPAWAFLALAAWLVGQLAAGMVAFPAATLLNAGLLVVAALLAGRAAAMADDMRGRIVAAFSAGLLVALLLNAVAVVFGWWGYEFHFYWLFPAPVLARAVGLIGQANHLGMLAVFATFAANALNSSGRLRTHGLWAVTVLAALVSAAAASRIAVAVWLVCAVLTVLWTRSSPDAVAARRRVALQVVLLAAAFLGVHFLGPEATDGHAAAAGLSRSDAGRTEMLRDAIALWESHPLAGIGNGNYAKGRLRELTGALPAPHTDNAHNLFAHALAEWGVVGGIIAGAGVVAVLLLVRRRFRADSHSPYELFASLWVVGLLLHSMVELPLWSAHFLFPFALMVGVLCRAAPEPPVSAADRGLARPALGAALAILLTATAAWDYARSQSVALKLLVESNLPPGSPALVRFADVAGIERLTLYPVFAKVQLARKLPLAGGASDQKLDIARQAMNAIPNPETIGRFAAFAVVAGRPDEASAVLDRLARGNPAHYEATLTILKAWAAMDARVAAFVAQRAAPAG